MKGSEVGDDLDNDVLHGEGVRQQVLFLFGEGRFIALNELDEVLELLRGELEGSEEDLVVAALLHFLNELHRCLSQLAADLVHGRVDRHDLSYFNLYQKAWRGGTGGPRDR